MSCPTQAELSAYLLGELVEAQASEFDEHIAGCSQCLDTLSQIDEIKHPSFEAVCQAAKHESFDTQSDDPTLFAMIDRLKSMSPFVLAPCEMAAETAPWRTGDSIDHYRLVKRIGQGGMGIVYEAEDERLRRRVAVKFIRAGLAQDDTFRRRFLREAQAAAAVSHDHLVPVYHVGEVDGLPYLVMPKLIGESLADRLSHQERLPPDEMIRIGRQLAMGLAAAHASGLVHRDLKPSNVWLEPPRDQVDANASSRVRILDFGLVLDAMQADRITSTGAVIGTPGYLAPEQVRSCGEIDPRCDLFALGVILFECLTGRLPFPADNWLSYLDAVANSQPDVNVLPGPPELRELVGRLLARDADHRPDSAAAVVAALQSIERSAQQCQTTNDVVKPARRTIVVASIAVAALVLLGATGAYFRSLRSVNKTPDTLPVTLEPAAAASDIAPDTRSIVATRPAEPQQAAETQDFERLLLREVAFDEEPDKVTQTNTMRYGVQDGVYFIECDGSQMRMVWKVFRFARVSKDFVLELRMRVRDAEYGVLFRQLDEETARRHWEWWANIKGTGRWKIDQVTSERDSTAGNWRITGKQTVAQGSEDDSPWMPNDQWRTLRIECVGDACRLTVEDRLVAEFEVSPSLRATEQPANDGLLLLLQSNAPDRNPRLEVESARAWTVISAKGPPPE